MSAPTTEPSLRSRALAAAKWGYMGAFGKLVIQLGAQIVIARILGPAEYGLFAIGAMVVGISNFFADAGIGALIVQRPQINDAFVRTIHTWQVVCGVVVSALVLLAAPWVAAFFSAPNAAPIIQALALVPLLQALGSCSSNLLRRELNFKPLQVAQVKGFFVGYVLVGVPAALLGAGVWSLVWAWLVQASVNTALVWRAAQPPKGWQWSAEGDGNSIWAFGRGAMTSNVFTWANTNVDKVIVGRAFPIEALGVYNAMTNLLMTAVSQVLSTLQSVLFSASSRQTETPEARQRTFLLILEAGCALLLPIFAAVACFPEEVLLSLYGAKWVDGIPLVAPIAIGVGLYGLAGTVTPFLWAKGDVGRESLVQIGGLLLMVLMVGVVTHQARSVYWTAIAAACAVCIRAVLTIAYAARRLGVPPLTALGRLALAVGNLGSLMFVITHLYRAFGAQTWPLAARAPLALTFSTLLALLHCWLLCRWGTYAALRTELSRWAPTRWLLAKGH